MQRLSFRISIFGVLTFIALAAVLAYKTHIAFALDFAPVHDYAADVLLANIIRDEGVLLVGHYSRFGFHHPGPFWFYWNHLFELCLGWLPLTRFQIWAIGSVAINSGLLFFAGRGLSDYLFDKIKYQVVFFLTAVFLLLVGGDFLATWMPNRLIATYVAFFICLLNLSRFKLNYLPWATLFCALLVHGYVTMPVLTLPPLMISLTAGYVLNRDKAVKNELYKGLLQSAIIALIFLIPLLADLLLPRASNIAKILAAQAGFLQSAKPTWVDVANFYKQLVFDQPFAQALYWVSLAAILPILVLRKKDALLRLIGIFLLSMLISGIVVLYYKTTPAPLYPFVARFYIGLSSVIVAAVWCILSDRIESLSKATTYLSRIALSVVFILSVNFSKQHESPIWADPQDARPIRLFADRIQHEAIGSRTIIINHSHHDQWGIVAGLMVELDRRNIRSCSTWQQMAFLFTTQMTCAVNAKPNYLVVQSAECEGVCVAESKGFGLKSIK